MMDAAPGLPARISETSEGPRSSRNLGAQARGEFGIAGRRQLYALRERRVTLAICVPLNSHTPFGLLAKQVGDLAEHRLRFGQDIRLVELKQYVGGHLKADLGSRLLDLEIEHLAAEILDCVHQIEHFELRKIRCLLLVPARRKAARQPSTR